MAQLGIENVLAVGHDEPVNVYVDEGRITRIGADREPAVQVIDGAGARLLPGMVDTHVHLMDPGEPDREDFPSGTAAAAASGVTTVLEHTHSRPVRTEGDLRAKREHLEGRSWVDFGLVSHAWPGKVEEAAGLWRAGVAYFKLFTCDTHGVPAHDAASLLEHFDRYAELDAPCLVHCEDDALTASAERELREQGRTDGMAIAEWRNALAEEVAVAEVALLARHTGARVGIAHCSSPAVASLASRERAAGAALAAEACPQYFLLRAGELAEQGTLRKFTPPARARDDRDEERMWELLREGELTFVSSDHAPSTRAQKSQGIWDAPFGLPGLDTTMALLLDAAVRGQLTFEELVRVYSEAPARQYGLWPRKGALRPGADADLLLIDPGSERTLRNEDVRSKAGWTPYAGRRVRGRVVAAWLRGEQVADDGAPVGERRGRFVPGAGAE
jgi:dihydroorotase (multifunctional complex type)